MISKDVQIAPLTTFHIGGPASFLKEVFTVKDIEDAIVCARENKLPLYTLGGGSNVLVPDAGVAGVVVRMLVGDITFENVGDDALLVAGAGAVWEDVVDRATTRGFFGIENLAGIPGTIGGASVQNIGAYGGEFKDVFAYADVIDTATGLPRRITSTEASFAYRTSFFKQHRGYIIIRVALRLTKRAVPNITYPDLLRVQATGAPLTTPKEIARTIRGIRALKFPQDVQEGSAGSFFKNPVISREHADELTRRFPIMPTFPQTDGSIKISLAWFLDHALLLKGFSIGRARLYERHPLVIVAQAGAHAIEVDALASEVEKRVHAATGITIEREVEMFGT